MTITGKGVYDAWVTLLEELLLAPVVSPRGQPCRERLGVQLRVTDAYQNIIFDGQRKLNYRFLVAEWLWMFVGFDRVDILARYNKRMAEFSDDGVRLAGAYGPRVTWQWPYVLRKLKEDPETRQAIIQVWTPCPEDSKDIPCTLSFQYLLRGNSYDGWKLNTVVTMRSSDAWLGIPYDVFSFSMLANGLAAVLSYDLGEPVHLGELIVNLGSSHLYAPHWADARSIVNAPTGSSGRSPELPRRVYVDPPAGIAELLADPTGPPEAYALPTMPWPWSAYAAVLRSATSSDALVTLINLEKVTDGKT